jgi:hypothetical protein
MNLRSDDSGAGSVTIGHDTLSVVSTSTSLYINAPKAFWASQSSSTVAERIGSRWVKLNRSANVCISALSSFKTALANYLGYPGSPTLLTDGQYAGKAGLLIGLTQDVSIWVAKTGTPLPVNVHDVGTSTDVNLTDWSKDVSVVVPAATQVVDGATLKG